MGLNGGAAILAVSSVTFLGYQSNVQPILSDQ